MLDFHALPGSQNQHWHSDNETHKAGFWMYRHFQDRVVHLWETLAARYRGNATVAGYNIMNEPADPEGATIKPFYDRVVEAVRHVDPDHIIFLDGNRYSTDFSAFENAPVYPNTVYTAHDYALPGFVDGGPYPGLTKGGLRRQGHGRGDVPASGRSSCADRHADLDRRVRAGVHRRPGARRAEVPAAGRPAGHLPAARRRLGDLGLQGRRRGRAGLGRPGLTLDAARPGIMAKKARLGVDHWGSLDTEIRHIMAPIEETFAKEYPEFDPFPFGQQSWISTLVRNILLAEPMVEEFGRCFADVTSAETARDLALLVPTRELRGAGPPGQRAVGGRAPACDLWPGGRA